MFVIAASIAVVANAQTSPVPLGETYTPPLAVKAKDAPSAVILVAGRGYKIAIDSNSQWHPAISVRAAAPLAFQQTKVIVYNTNMAAAKQINALVVPEGYQLLLYVYYDVNNETHLASWEVQRRRY